MTSTLLTEAHHYVPEMTALRRAIHRRPELGWTEFETTWRIFGALSRLPGWRIQVGREVIEPTAVRGRNAAEVEAAQKRALAAGVPEDFMERLGGYTGVVAEFDTGRPGPTTVLRFDIDCVAVEECHAAPHTPAVEGFDSTIPGSMHSCGHDVHTSAGCALAHWVSDHAGELDGRIRILFQPAEEGTRGGAAMAAKGWVNDADYFFGSHVGIICRTGEAAVMKAGFLATTKIDVHFTGTPSHAGAEPEKGRSALTAAAATVMMIQGIPRSGEGDTRISVGSLIAGEGRNVTPAHAVLKLETRGATHEVNEYMVANVRNMVEGAARAYGVEAKIEIAGAATTLVTTPKGVALLKEAAQSAFGADHVRLIDRLGGSEDCTTLMRCAVEHGADGAFLLYGGSIPHHHKPDFDVNEAADFPQALAAFFALLRETNGAR
ncbi:amidohydrolase [Sutterella sp.]|uniref:amidohydrolase n=1 Tax=Sutterella sp. TaxID=1981025 RepID=UPI003FD6FEA4